MPQKTFISTGFLLIFIVLSAAILSYFFVDRLWASIAFQNFHTSRASFVTATRLSEWLEIAAVAVLAWTACVFARGKAFGSRGLIALRTMLALFLAIGIKEVAKFSFGRTWPETWTCNNPSFIRDGAYGFTPFHGGSGWASFPSGHQAMVCAVAGCLWILEPRLRPLCIVAVLAVAIGLLGADFHWLSDVLVGGLLGWLIGVFVAKLELPKAARQL